jgi:hypothetical protein
LKKTLNKRTKKRKFIRFNIKEKKLFISALIAKDKRIYTGINTNIVVMNIVKNVNIQDLF